MLGDLWRREHEQWLLRKLESYADTRQDVLMWTETEPPLGVTTYRGLVRLNPALALFACSSSVANRRGIPLLVAEFVTDGDFTKTWKGNSELYLRWLGVAEHWVVDLRDGPKWLVLSIRRFRDGREWLNEFCRGDDFNTPTLPGFELLVDPCE